ncbi:MAG TPA: hypothetical protein VGG75_41820 [Trebonia sp.]
MHEGDDALDRLSQLGLKLEYLEYAFRKADAEARTYTEHDPPSASGIARWSRTNRFLRDRLVPEEEWTSSNPHNVPITTSPDKMTTIIATTGDDDTGIASGSPTTKYAKGQASIRAIRRNRHVQDVLPFFDTPPSTKDGKALAEAVHDRAGTTRIWLLLYTVTLDGIRAEISSPADITNKGIVNTWDERIILPFLPFEEAPAETGGEGSGSDNDQGIDVPVDRR